NAGIAPAAIAPATIISRAPAFDSAVIKSDRLGGNFAYSVAESHAYAAHTPIIQQVATPVAVSYSAQAPIIAAGPALALSAGIPAELVGPAAPAVVA
ncbi:unnamed protein product, partial [Allacma fusca]